MRVMRRQEGKNQRPLMHKWEAGILISKQKCAQLTPDINDMRCTVHFGRTSAYAKAT